MQLFLILVYVFLLVLFIIGAGDEFNGAEPELGMLSMIVLLFGGLFLLANIIPGIAITVRRFHDQDKSGWMYLLTLIPYIGGIIVLVFMLIKGTEGENRFGADPLGDSLADTFD